MFRSKHIVGMDASIDIPETTTHQQTGQQFEHVSLDFLPSFRAFRSCVDRKWTKKSRDLQHLQIYAPREPSTCGPWLATDPGKTYVSPVSHLPTFCRPLEELSDTELWTEQLETMRIQMGWLFCVRLWSWDVVQLFLATQAIYILTYRLHTLQYVLVCINAYTYVHLDSQSYMNNILCVTRAWRVEQIFGSLLNSYCIDIFWRIDTYFTCKQRQYF